jgi:hypothetical protein
MLYPSSTVLRDQHRVVIAVINITEMQASARFVFAIPKVRL